MKCKKIYLCLKENLKEYAIFLNIDQYKEKKSKKVKRKWLIF